MTRTAPARQITKLRLRISNLSRTVRISDLSRTVRISDLSRTVRISDLSRTVSLAPRMMADNESVLSATDKSDTPTHSVDYYYHEVCVAVL